MRQTTDDVETQLELPIHHLHKAILQSIVTEHPEPKPHPWRIENCVKGRGGQKRPTRRWRLGGLKLDDVSTVELHTYQFSRLLCGYLVRLRPVGPSAGR